MSSEGMSMASIENLLPGGSGFVFGGDYNPEQWPEHVQDEDIALMVQAGVNLVSVAIFSWATIEPARGKVDFGWLDRTMDRLHAAGIRVALATATASPPPWLTARHPQILPVDIDGRTLWPGGRQAYSVTHPIWRKYARRMAERMARRYCRHPALALWHVDNEIGAHVPRDYSDAAARAFRTWLRRRYTSIDALNEAWGTAFWSQRYSDFRQILPPRRTPTTANPTQQLDFARFSSDAQLDYLKLLIDAVRRHSPLTPVTSNMMIQTRYRGSDYFDWASSVDVIANDHYLDTADPEPHVELALSADLTRAIAGDRPWMLMEHSTSAINWQPHNRAKRQGEMLRNSIAHVARGADAVMFFQWRQSLAGSEKFHSAMIPHAGVDSEVWEQTLRLGDLLRRITEVAGSRVVARAAIVFDYQAWWATDLDSHPSVDVTYLDQLRAYYRELWRLGVTVDFVHPRDDLTRYDFVAIPSLYLVRDGFAARLTEFVEQGGTAVIGYFSGIVNEEDHVIPGGYPGAFRQLLGVRTEEFAPLLPGERVLLSDGTFATVWAERMGLVDAEPIVTYEQGDLSGAPAVTRRNVAGGRAWYVGTRLSQESLASILESALGEAGIAVGRHIPGLEVVTRTHPDGTSYVFAINHTDREVALDLAGEDMLSGHAATVERDHVEIAPGGVALVRVPRLDSDDNRHDVRRATEQFTRRTRAS